MEPRRGLRFGLVACLVLMFSGEAWGFWGMGPVTGLGGNAVARGSKNAGSQLFAQQGMSHPSRVGLQMSDTGFGTGTQKKGGVKVGVKEREDTKTSPKEREKFEVEWRVLLHNDDVHTFDYVSRNLAEVIPTLTRSKAWECALAAHANDFSTLAIVTKTTAEEYCMKLQKSGLTISVSPDSNFEKEG